MFWAYKLCKIRTFSCIWNYSVEHFVYLNITKIYFQNFWKGLKLFIANLKISNWKFKSIHAIIPSMVSKANFSKMTISLKNAHFAEVNRLRRCISLCVYFLGKFLGFASEKITMVLSSVICVFIPLWIFISSSEKYLGFEMSPNVT